MSYQTHHSTIQARRLQQTFWGLLFVVFPLALIPTPLLEHLPDGLITIPQGELAELLIPKVVVFIALWLVGLRALQLSPPRDLGLGRGAAHPLFWLRAFLVVLVGVSLFTRSHLDFHLGTLGPRALGVLITLVDGGYFALAALTYALTRRTVLAPETPLRFMVAGAVSVGGWAFLEAYGFSPMRLLGGEVILPDHAPATLGHQGFVAAFVGTALVTWGVYRLLRGTFSLPDGLVMVLLSAALTASGGRAGTLACMAFWALFLVWQVRHPRRRGKVLLLSGVMIMAALSVTLTSGHTQRQLGNLGRAARGADLSTIHRGVFWQAAIKAIAEEPLTGYGPGGFADVLWRHLSPEQTRTVLRGFVPDEFVAHTTRVGRTAVYYDPDSGARHTETMNNYKAHNYLLDLALSHGLLAAILFALFVLSCARALWLTRAPLARATLFGIGTYLLYGMVWFATFQVDPMIWAITGVGLASVKLEPLADHARLPGKLLER